jgi:lipid II:glycine glycyltransferase (peptidoglycan interpeptide bridge formation enzyme)
VHIVQSPIWEKFKQAFGTQTIRVGEVYYTKHAIPFTGKFYAYCPKVDPFKIDFVALRTSLEKEKCAAINFDVPNILVDSSNAEKAKEVFESAGCTLSPKSTFTKYNLILDLRPSEEELLANMHPKHRYNIKLAQKKGVTVREATSQDDFEIFYELAIKTSERQGFYIHPKNYYQKIWEVLGAEKVARILIADYKGKPLASWMFFIYDGVIYYPYGGSSDEYQNLQASNLLGWEGILLGKGNNCREFDMWGASANPDDKNDPYWGFTNFKMKFGPKHVQYIPSYDLVLNPILYKAFNTANKLRWIVLKTRKSLK